jgi:hypothetical protein
VPVYREDGSVALDHEESPRAQTTLEGLSALRASFAALADVPIDDKGTTHRSLILQKYPGLEIEFIHHAGNSSGVVDGSAARFADLRQGQRAEAARTGGGHGQYGRRPDPDAERLGSGGQEGAGEGWVGSSTTSTFSTSTRHHGPLLQPSRIVRLAIAEPGGDLLSNRTSVDPWMRQDLRPYRA